MTDPKIFRLARKIQKPEGCQVPPDLIVRPGQVREVARAFWGKRRWPFGLWPAATPVLVLRAGGYEDDQVVNDDLDVLMPDGTIETCQVNRIVRMGP